MHYGVGGRYHFPEAPSNVEVGLITWGELFLSGMLKCTGEETRRQEYTVDDCDGSSNSVGYLELSITCHSTPESWGCPSYLPLSQVPSTFPVSSDLQHAGSLGLFSMWVLGEEQPTELLKSDFCFCSLHGAPDAKDKKKHMHVFTGKLTEPHGQRNL